ncbi:MAG TPA: hypothetical protein VF613_03110 [Longimicrobium sp.]|jgi:hypothetical protein
MTYATATRGAVSRPAAAGPVAWGPAPRGLPAWLAVLWAAAVVATLAFAAVGGVHHAVVGVAAGVAFMAVGAGLVALMAPSDRAFATRLLVGGFLSRYVAAPFITGAVVAAGPPGREGGKDYLHWEASGWAVLLSLVVPQSAGPAGEGDLLARFPNPFASLAAARESWVDEVGAGSAGLTRYLYGRNLLLAPHLLLPAMVLPFILPLPGTTGGVMSIGTFLMPGQVLWLLLLPPLLAGMAGALRERVAARMSVAGLVLALALGVALAGYISSPRYLAQGVPLMLVLSGRHRIPAQTPAALRFHAPVLRGGVLPVRSCRGA